MNVKPLILRTMLLYNVDVADAKCIIHQLTFDIFGEGINDWKEIRNELL